MFGPDDVPRGVPIGPLTTKMDAWGAKMEPPGPQNGCCSEKNDPFQQTANQQSLVLKVYCWRVAS